MPRFQFSLRALLVAMTVACLGLGWIVDRARRRGAAIDALDSKYGSLVFYGNLTAGDLRIPYDVDMDTGEELSHFWLDVKREPVEINLDEQSRLNAVIGEHIKCATPLSSLTIWNAHDEDLKHLNGINKGCEITISGDLTLSEAAVAELEKRLPGVKVTDLTVRPLDL